MMFKKICIIGCGLIGSSIAREIKNEGVRRHNKAKRKSDRIKGSY